MALGVRNIQNTSFPNPYKAQKWMHITTLGLKKYIYFI
jgi:hypothetical protein